MGNAVRKRKGANARRQGVSSRRKGSQREEKTSRVVGESLGVLLFVLALFLAASLYSFLNTSQMQGLSGFYDLPKLDDYENLMGPVGHVMATVLFRLLGYCSFVTVLWAILLGRTVWMAGWPQGSNSFTSLLFSITGSLGMAASCATFASVIFGYEGGGEVGSYFAFNLVRYVNDAGTLLLSLATLLLSVGMATGIGGSKIIGFVRWFGMGIKNIFADTGYVSGKVIRSFSLGNLAILKTIASFLVSSLKWIFQFPSKVAFERVRDTVEGLFARREVSPSFDPEARPFVMGEEEDEDDDQREVLLARGDVRISRRTQSLAIKSKKKSPLQKIRGHAKEGKKAASFVEPDFSVPSLDFLVPGDENFSGAPQDSDLVKNSQRLEKTLLDFRIGGKVVEVHPGPVITLYEFEPAAGVKVQRVITLADDLALALKVASVRVYAPVPGKGTVGIEVPNEEREIVRLRDILDSSEFRNNDHALRIALGKTTFGDPNVGELARMPHLLIAGATGTGKSVCLNSLLLSLLYQHTPKHLQLLLIDPKMLELSIYEDIPHLKAPVVTNAKRARGVLWWAAEEMERRYRLMREVGVRNLASYNRLAESKNQENNAQESSIIDLDEDDAVATVGLEETLERDGVAEEANIHKPEVCEYEVLPRIVIVVDELADLMLTVGREIEELLTRLAQKARAAGIHLILATQRPSVNVITGLIKANFPARISFRVASKIDARTVMDTTGAEKLLGNGDMLFMAPGASHVKRLHSPFVSDKEVQDVVSALRAQGAPQYDVHIEEMIEKIEDSEKTSSGDSSEDEYDSLYDEAVQLVVEKGQASTSMVQRVFRIGYNRAARILETMEREGVVGPADGAKPRKVMLPNRDSL